MNAWMIAYLALGFFGLGLHLARDGQPRNDQYSFWGALASWSVPVSFLYMAGAFHLPN